MNSPSSGSRYENGGLLVLRLLCLAVLVALLTIHIRSVRVFRWEQSVTGGVLVTYVVGLVGMVLCAGVGNGGAKVFQVYLSGVGVAVLSLNAVIIYRRWNKPNNMTRVVSELLEALGVPLRRQIIIKATLSAAAAFLLMVDLSWNMLMYRRSQSDSKPSLL